MSNVQAGIAALQYAPVSADGVIVASNRAHGMQATFEPEGVRISGRTGGPADVRMSLRSWGREGVLTNGVSVAPQEGDCFASGAVYETGECLRRVHYVRDGLVEWWENRTEGLEQGFTVMSPPPGDGLLVFDLVVDGAVVVVEEGNGTAATFYRQDAQSLFYNNLVAWDEDGRTLPAWMEETDDGLRLVVDDSHARGTVTVDPLLTETWTVEGTQPSSHLGLSVASAGDVNGDGYGDVVLTADGMAFLYLGSADGLSTDAAWSAQSDVLFGWFGPVSSAGDVNGDGYGDVLVGEPEYFGVSQNAGRALIYFGSATGLATTAGWTAEGNGPGLWTRFGWSVSSAGDVNGDGYDDVVIGSLAEKVYVFAGSAAGPARTATWTARYKNGFSFFGWSVSSAGDVNGDGYDDVVVGAPYTNTSYAGKAYVYLGSATGLTETSSWDAKGASENTTFGFSVSAAGDVNGDGYGDVIVGGPGYNNPATRISGGGAWLYLGSAAGLEPIAAWTAESELNGSSVGQDVSSAGDTNGDGYDDVVVGGAVNDASGDGSASVYLGPSRGLGTRGSWTALGPEGQFSSFGSSVSSAGDVNGDGYDDVLVGAPSINVALTGEGAAYVYAGHAFVDTDADSVEDAFDVCPGFDDLLDSDLDGMVDGCDVCPHVADAGQEDADGNGVGDACVPLTLNVGTVSILGGLSVDVGDAIPGETVTVFLGSGPPGIGPCSSYRAAQCLDFGEAKRTTRWDIAADAAGHAALTVDLPVEATLDQAVIVQAGAARGVGGVVSNSVEAIVTP